MFIRNLFATTAIFATVASASAGSLYSAAPTYPVKVPFLQAAIFFMFGKEGDDVQYESDLESPISWKARVVARAIVKDTVLVSENIPNHRGVIIPATWEVVMLEDKPCILYASLLSPREASASQRKWVADLWLGNSQPQPMAVESPHDRPDEAYIEAIGVALPCAQFNAAIGRIDSQAPGFLQAGEQRQQVGTPAPLTKRVTEEMRLAVCDEPIEVVLRYRALEVSQPLFLQHAAVLVIEIAPKGRRQEHGIVGFEFRRHVERGDFARSHACNILRVWHLRTQVSDTAKGAIPAERWSKRIFGEYAFLEDSRYTSQAKNAPRQIVLSSLKVSSA